MLGIGKNSTHLSPEEDRCSNIRKITGSPRSDENQIGDGGKGKRLDNDSDKCVVQFIDRPCGSPHGFSEVPTVQEEFRDDHECQKDIEPNGDREARKTKNIRDVGPRSRVPVDGYKTQRCQSGT